MKKAFPLLFAICLSLVYLWVGTIPAKAKDLAPVPDWLAHGAAYTVLAGSYCWAGVGRTLAVSLGTAHGGLLELLQREVPGRTAELKDFLADFLGCLAGIWLMRGRA